MDYQQKLTLIIILVQVFAILELQGCPAGGINVTGDGGPWCVFKPSDENKMTFCEAVKTCHSHGAEMISKPVFDGLKSASSMPSSEKWWVGLIDALHERGHDKAGWVWMKDGQVTTESDDYFERSEPNDNSLQDCTNVDNDSFGLRDAECNEEHETFCYIDPTVQEVNNPVGKYERVNIIDFNQPDYGCSFTHANTTSRLYCVIACFTMGSDCVGFFWNPKRRECIILPYFDAAVQLAIGDPSDALWEKFIKKA